MPLHFLSLTLILIVVLVFSSVTPDVGSASGKHGEERIQTNLETGLVRQGLEFESGTVASEAMPVSESGQASEGPQAEPIAAVSTDQNVALAVEGSQVETAKDLAAGPNTERSDIEKSQEQTVPMIPPNTTTTGVTSSEAALSPVIKAR